VVIKFLTEDPKWIFECLAAFVVHRLIAYSDC